MRIKIHRRSAPRMNPITSDPISKVGAEKTLNDLGSGSNVILSVDGHDTLFMYTDISYVQIIED